MKYNLVPRAFSLAREKALGTRLNGVNFWTDIIRPLSRTGLKKKTYWSWQCACVLKLSACIKWLANLAYIKSISGASFIFSYKLEKTRWFN